MAEGCVLQDRQVVVQTRAQPHDICRILELPGCSPFVLHGSDATAEEISANHLYCEPGNPETMDPGNCDCELLVLRIEAAPVLAANHFRLSERAERLWIFLLNPAPLGPPFVPLLAVETVWVYLLVPCPWNPGDRTRKGVSCFDAGDEIVAEEGCAGNYSDKILTEMGED